MENQKQAIEILIQAVSIAQSKGSFTLSDARVVSNAVDFLQNELKVQEEVSGVVKEKEDIEKTKKDGKK